MVIMTEHVGTNWVRNQTKLYYSCISRMKEILLSPDNLIFSKHDGLLTWFRYSPISRRQVAS